MSAQKRMKKTYNEVVKLYLWCKQISESLLACTESTNFTEEIGRKYLKDVPVLAEVDDWTLQKEISAYKEIVRNWGMKVCSGICDTTEANKNIKSTMDAISFAFDRAKERYLLKITDFLKFCLAIEQTLDQATEKTDFREEVGKYVRDGNPESNFFDDEFGKIKNIIRKCCTGEMQVANALKKIQYLIKGIEKEAQDIESLKIE